MLSLCLEITRSGTREDSGANGNQDRGKKKSLRVENSELFLRRDQMYLYIPTRYKEKDMKLNVSYVITLRIYNNYYVITHSYFILFVNKDRICGR